MVSMTETERPPGSVTWRMSDAFTMAAWCHEGGVLSVAAGFGSAENVMLSLAAGPSGRARALMEEIRGVVSPTSDFHADAATATCYMASAQVFRRQLADDTGARRAARNTWAPATFKTS